jgi:hypothetical protein
MGHLFACRTKTQRPSHPDESQAMVPVLDKHIPDSPMQKHRTERNSFPEAVNPVSLAPDDTETAGACWTVDTY